MLINDHWYIACPSVRLSTHEPLAVQVGEIDLALFRDNNGTAHALADRCCHRGVKLSLGRMSDGNLACGYHGWEYDGDGKVVKIPSLMPGDTCPSHATESFNVAEIDGYVWVWIAGASTTPTYEAGMPILNDLGAYWGQRTEIWDADIVDAVENQMDFAHTVFSHPGNYPGHQQPTAPKRAFPRLRGKPPAPAQSFIPPVTPTDVECRFHDGGLEAFLPPAGDAEAAPPNWRNLVGWARFELPYRNYVFLTAQRVLAIYNWVPLPDHKCRLEFMFSVQPETDEGTIAQVDGTSKIINYWEPEVELLNQDRRLLESAKKWMATGTRDFEVSVEADFPQLQTRRLIRAAQEGKGHAPDFDGKRHIFSAQM